MQAFLNECSVHGQHYDLAAFEKALEELTATLSLLHGAELAELETFFARTGYDRIAIVGKRFCQSLAMVRERSLVTQFKILVLDRLGAKDWLNSQTHQIRDSFTWGTQAVTSTSLAELSERLLCHQCSHGLLLNLSKSQFAAIQVVPVAKNGAPPIGIPCVENAGSLTRWLDQVFPQRFHPYGYVFGQKLSVKQTVLRDQVRFRRTKRISKINTCVFEEKTTGRLWFIDNFHSGMGAHLEVFGADGNHIGEASPDGTIDLTKRDPKKTLKD